MVHCCLLPRLLWIIGYILTGYVIVLSLYLLGGGSPLSSGSGKQSVGSPIAARRDVSLLHG